MKNKQNLIIFLAVFAAFLGVGVYFQLSQQALAAKAVNPGGALVIQNGQLIKTPLISDIFLLTATSTEATSTSVDILGAKKVTVYAISTNKFGTTTASQAILSVTATGIATSSDYTFDTMTPSNEAPYFRLNSLIGNLENSNSQTLTRTNTKILSATTTMVSVDLNHDVISRLKCHISNVNVLGDTTMSVACRVLIQW